MVGHEEVWWAVFLTTWVTNSLMGRAWVCNLEDEDRRAWAWTKLDQMSFWLFHLIVQMMAFMLAGLAATATLVLVVWAVTL